MGLVFGVNVLVVPEMVLSSKCLAAHITGEGAFISVCPLVDHNIVGLGELAVAVLADEPLLGPGRPALGVHVEPVVIAVGGGCVGGRGGQQAGVLARCQPLLQQQGLAEAGEGCCGEGEAGWRHGGHLDGGRWGGRGGGGGRGQPRC